MNEKEEVKLTFSGVLVKNGERLIQVRFERENGNGLDVAEGTLPAGTIHSSKGYSEEEIAQLQIYLQQNQAEIMKKAKELNNIMHWF
ncbi:MAG: hypothetical protein ACI4HI_14150 [Lachnospiraceae bacterium]